jgi:hypothetical protein
MADTNTPMKRAPRVVSNSVDIVKRVNGMRLRGGERGVSALDVNRGKRDVSVTYKASPGRSANSHESTPADRPTVPASVRPCESM